MESEGKHIIRYASIQFGRSCKFRSYNNIIRIYIKINFDEGFSENSKLNLPSCVTEHMTSITISSIINSSIPVFSEWILTLSSLDDVILDYYKPCEDDYLLYQSLKSSTKLRRI